MAPKEPVTGSWLVLRLLYQSGQAMNPGSMLNTLRLRTERPPSQSSITRALRELEDRDLIVGLDVAGSYYVLTQTGVEFVEEELDAKPLPGPSRLTGDDLR